MKTYNVSLNFIVSNSEGLYRLRNFFVNNKTVVFGERILDDEILARIEPCNKNEKSALDQIAVISKALDYTTLIAKVEFYEKIYIDIAIYYTTFTCSMSLSGEFIKYCLAIHPQIDIDLTCYPTDDDK